MTNKMVFAFPPILVIIGTDASVSCHCACAYASPVYSSGTDSAHTNAADGDDRTYLKPHLYRFTGTLSRATFTCVGDTVTLAAHLESHTN